MSRQFDVVGRECLVHGQDPDVEHNVITGSNLEASICLRSWIGATLKHRINLMFRIHT